MATQPTKWSIQIGINSEKANIPINAGADQIDLSKLYPSSYELPLDAGGNTVGRTEMNALFSTIAENVYFQQQGGVYQYANNVNYTVGTVVLYSNNIYKCIRANGPASTVANPTNTTYWTRFALITDINPLYNLVPTGVILPYGGVTAPSGFLICDGSAVSRTAYANLFAVIGTRYGAGNGSTTFNVPKLNDGSFVRGVASGSVGTKYSASLPPLTASSAGAHTHTRGTMEITGRAQFDGSANGGYSASGALKYSGYNGIIGTGGGDGADNNIVVNLKASDGWTGATSSNGAHIHTVTNNAGVVMNGTTVLPQSVGTNFIIKI